MGDEVGTMGNTGNAKNFGTHTHIEVRIGGIASTQTKSGPTEDPEQWISEGNYQAPNHELPQ